MTRGAETLAVSDTVCQLHSLLLPAYGDPGGLLVTNKIDRSQAGLSDGGFAGGGRGSVLSHPVTLNSEIEIFAWQEKVDSLSWLLSSVSLLEIGTRIENAICLHFNLKWLQLLNVHTRIL